MVEKIGRNDPCPCGSKKKFKQCCMNPQTGKKKIKATWVKSSKTDATSTSTPLDLLERTFGNVIPSADVPFTPKKEIKISKPENR